MNTDLHVVLGASGAIGRAVVAELVARGHRVRAVQRGEASPGPQVEIHRGDITTAAGAAGACAGAAVVYQCAQPAYARWTEQFVPMTRTVLDGVRAAGAKLVFADNLYMYGPVDGPMTEDLPYAAGYPKGRVRAEVARMILDAGIPATMGRASDYYGPGGLNTTIGPNVFAAALAGRTARWVGPLDQPHTVSYLPDIAAGLVTLGERPEADGRAWHLPAAEPVTGRQFVDLVFAALGKPAKVAGLGRGLQRMIGLFNPVVRELGETWYQRDRPFVSDFSAYDKAFGPSRITPLARGIAETLEWFGQGQNGPAR